MKYIVIFILLLVTGISYANNCGTTVIPKLGSNSPNSEVVKYLTSLKSTVLFSDEKVEGSFCYEISWYKSHMRKRQLSSRGLAILVIILGALIPLVNFIKKETLNQKFIVAAIGAAIVISQGFSQTFQNEQSWQSYTQAKLELEGLLRGWQIQIIDAAIDKENGLEKAKKATELFSTSMTNIINSETKYFFNTLQPDNENDKTPIKEIEKSG